MRPEGTRAEPLTTFSMRPEGPRSGAASNMKTFI
jgi:hypothetical protein